jgi:predicted DsbA family dithiol-disulfide isomerase
MNDSTVLTVYTDFVCPWCYLGTRRIERLQREYEIRVDWVYFPLHPDTPDEGIPIEALFAGRGYDLDAMHVAMKNRMDAEGLPYEKRTHTYNSRLAQELARWAETKEGGESLHEALYQAYFVDGQNLADPEVLARIAGSAGLPAGEARRVTSERIFREEVDRNWEDARRAGVTGVPTFAAGGRGVVGAQPYEVLERLVVHAGAHRRERGEAGDR